MPRQRVSPENKTPLKKKRRVKSKSDKMDNNAQGGANGGDNPSGVRQFDNTYSSVFTPTMAFMNNNMQQPFPTSQPMNMHNNMKSTPVMYSPTSQGPATNPIVNPAMNQMSFRPDWASELIDSVNSIKKDMGKLTNIEKSLSTLSLKFTNLETKVSTMEQSVTNCETSCTFLSASFDDQKKNINTCNENVERLRKNVKDLESKGVRARNM